MAHGTWARIRMERCLTKDQLLQAPQEGLTYPSYGQTTPPFELKGGFYTTLPQVLTGKKVYLRKPNVTTDTSNFVSYFAADNYQEIPVQGENMLRSDTSSTLRFNQKTFDLRFGLLHRSIWSSSGLQVSLVFISQSRTLFHICIPVVIGGELRNENQFLASWLGRKPIPGSGLSLNELVNFRGSESDVRFATMEFCLKYNVRTQANGKEVFDLSPYTVCMFKNPIYIQSQTCPDWLRNEPNFDSAPIMLKDVRPPLPGTWRIRDFNECFNLMFNIKKQVLSQTDPFVLSSEEHFENTRDQNVVKPTYFKVNTTSLTGRPLTSKQTAEGVRGLQNVKCYPIDLAHQVDDGGNIYIDQTSNKPVNVKDAVTGSKSGNVFPDEIDGGDMLDVSVEAAQAASRVRFWIAFAVIMLILIAFLVTIIVYVFRGTSFSKTEFVPANMPIPPVAAVSVAPAAVAVAAANAIANAPVVGSRGS